MNRHAYANTYKFLCQKADEMSKIENRGKKLENGWEVIDNHRDRGSNFKGVLYGKDGQYALTFVGTDKKNIKDWGANLKMGLTGNSKQIDEAIKFAKNMKDSWGLTTDNTVSIGHSEGGTEATIVGLENGLKTTTFNPFGIWKSKYKDKDYSLVTNYRDANDPVSKLHENVGDTYIVPSSAKAKTPFGSLKAHPLETMGDLEQSIEKEEYKRNNKFFLDKLSEADISREDIAQFEPELFALYEDEINQRLMKNLIKQKSQFNLANYRNLHRNGYFA